MAACPLRPIRTKTDLARATKVIDALVDRGESDLWADEREYLEVLSLLVEKYEEVHYPIQESTPAEALAVLIEPRGIKQKDLAAETGLPLSTISELISEKREFTANHIRKLSAFFKVSADVFVTKPKLVEA